MNSLRQSVAALLLAIPILGGCNGKTDSVEPSKSTPASAKQGTPKRIQFPGPESWDSDPATEGKVTFYVEGMSKRLKLT